VIEESAFKTKLTSEKRPLSFCQLNYFIDEARVTRLPARPALLSSHSGE
jgi:hypothetical protein